MCWVTIDRLERELRLTQQIARARNERLTQSEADLRTAREELAAMRAAASTHGHDGCLAERDALREQVERLRVLVGRVSMPMIVANDPVEWTPGTTYCCYPYPTVEQLLCSLALGHQGQHSTSRFWPHPMASEASLGGDMAETLARVRDDRLERAEDVAMGYAVKSGVLQASVDKAEADLQAAREDKRRLEGELAEARKRLGRHETEQAKLVEAGHPTAENGQCPICYSEGYEQATARLGDHA